MITDIRRLLEAVPFQAFFVQTSEGVRYHVASSDHAGFNPRGTQVVIWFDDGGSITISALHIVALEKEAPVSETAA